ncbi:MAG: plasmid stabilization system [archaeon GW2011_AR19]|nr:MAG: plasmid stabilization system [archaeon GW2011_AR19]
MFEIKWEEKAQKELYKLENQISSRIYKKINELKQGFQSKDIKRIQGENKFRLRVGDYRVLFSLENDLITIWKIGHRKNICD